MQWEERRGEGSTPGIEEAVEVEESEGAGNGEGDGKEEGQGQGEGDGDGAEGEGFLGTKIRRHVSQKTTLLTSPLRSPPYALSHGNRPSAWHTHHAGRGQRPRREEDVHTPAIVPNVRVNTKGERIMSTS